MSANYIVQRQTPDWLTFDIEQSRGFLKSAGLDENIVVDFVAIWDAQFRVDYRTWRDRVKRISVANYRSVEAALLVSRDDFDDTAIFEDDLVVFVDDDDWLKPNLFSVLRPFNVSAHGARWGSVRVGMVGTPSDFDPEVSQIALRPLSPMIFTNNYAVGGSLIAAIGVDPVFQHSSAQYGQDIGKFIPTAVPAYLSAANKHICSSMSAKGLLSSEWFRSNPRGAVGKIFEELSATTIPAEANWIAPAFQQYLELFSEAMR